MPSPTEITVNQLSRLIGTPAVPLIIDVRTDEDFELDPDLIPGVFRYPFNNMASLAPDLINRRVMVYCQKGKKISQGAMAVLRNHGIKAESLEGGHFAWRDAGDVFWSQRGDNCTFDTMLEEISLQSDALKKLAIIIRGADTNRHDLAPQSAGLLAASLGLSRMYRDDLEQLDAGMLLYDAFYRWARDASDESHDWPQSSTKA